MKVEPIELYTNGLLSTFKIRKVPDHHVKQINDLKQGGPSHLPV